MIHHPLKFEFFVFFFAFVFVHFFDPFLCSASYISIIIDRFLQHPINCFLSTPLPYGKDRYELHEVLAPNGCCALLDAVIHWKINRNYAPLMISQHFCYRCVFVIRMFITLTNFNKPVFEFI